MENRQLWLDEPPAWERDVDALVRPSLLVEPPADVQASILAAVLQATAPAQATVTVTPLPAAATARPIPLVAYLLLAAVCVAYVAALSWFQSFVGGSGWLSTLFGQLLSVSEIVVGRSPSSEPLALISMLFQRAPWLTLLPLAWLLWERDRADTRVA